jgi:ABC-type phosphate transport system substrate-binding protein
MERRLGFAETLRLIICFALLAAALATWGCGERAARYTISVYTRSDACGAADTWALYLDGHKQDDLKGTGINSDPGIGQAVTQDKLGIGYTNLSYAYDMETGLQLSGLRVVPIDVDGNGRIDDAENFYGTKQEMAAAIAEGRYPSPPARDLYFVAKGEFTGVAKEFVRWVLTDGQQYVEQAGYVRLPQAKIDAALDKLGDNEVSEPLTGNITISGAFALYPMTVTWKEDFAKLHPDVTFDISSGGAGKGMTDVLAGMVDFAMVSREINTSEIERGAFYVPVTKDCVVAIVDAKNPLLDEIMQSGMTKQQFVDIWINRTLTDWRDVTG